VVVDRSSLDCHRHALSGDLEIVRLRKEMKRPNQALQHNDHVCHGLCGRTLRASHGRG
jgi:hypothetical protein